MDKLPDKFAKEAACFDDIVTERFANGMIPDLRVDFVNEYFYNNIWRNSLFLKAEYGPLCEWIINSLRERNVSSVVELGCGMGFVALELAREGFSTTGVDLSEESIRVARAYSDRLENKEQLSLRYLCKNIVDYEDEYQGESVVCFGFLHHLPPEVLDELLRFLSQRMNDQQVLLLVEPRYDHTSFPIALLTYALRLSLPNHFKYPNPQEDIVAHLDTIFEELAETSKEQSVMDNESPSDVVAELVEKHFRNVDLAFSTSFYDKLIGGIRVEAADIESVSNTLKELDGLIAKYNQDSARTLMIRASN